MDPDKEENPYDAIEYGDFSSYFRHKRQKLLLQQEEIAALAPADLTPIFEDVIVYVNGYTDPPVHDIRNMIVQRGGEFTQFLQKSKVTHIIASNLTQAKMKEFRNYKVAKPEWVVESVKANRLLPWHNFSTLRTPMSLTKFGVSITETSSSAPSPIPVQEATAAMYHEPTPEPALAAVDVDLAKDPSGDADEEALNDQEEEALNDQEEESQTWEGYGLDEELFFDNDALMDDDLDPRTLDNAAAATTQEGPPQAAVAQPPITTTVTGPQPPIVSGYKVIPPAFNPYAKILVAPPTSSIEGDDKVPGSGVPEPHDNGEVDTRHPTLIELSVPWNRLNSSVQPGFVEKFYQSSRLHYLSTWKAKLREITADIQKDRTPVTSKFKNRTIMHVDFDCFFASVAARGKPELLSKPIGVAHGSGGSTSNSEIASCNYLARDFGVKNGMHLKRARSLCPDLIVVPYEFQQYEDISIEFYKILLSYADELQAVSVDEALVDVTSKCLPYWEEKSLPHQYSSSSASGAALSTQEQDAANALVGPEAFAQRVRDEILAATGCHASIGIGPNILLAKLSTKRAKPHGQYIWPSAPGSEKTVLELQGGAQWMLPTTQEDSSMQTSVGSHEGSQQIDVSPSTPTVSPVVPRKTAPLKEFRVKDLPGVGYKISDDLETRLEVESLSQLQKIKRDELQRICGMKTGEMLYKFCRGIDDTTLASDREKARQSVSAEISWGVRFENQTQVNSFIRDLAKEIHKRLREIDRMAKSVVIKIMKRKEYTKGQWKHLGHGPVDLFSRTGQLPMYTDDPDLIANEALKLLKFFKFDVLDLRGLGIQVLKLNNDVINTVSKAAFLPYESKNQTTLSSAMFQHQPQHPRPAAVVSASVSAPSPPATHPSRASSPKARDESHVAEDDPDGGAGPPPKSRMDIDQATFNELPVDIQEDLRRHHELVFLRHDAAEPETPQDRPQDQSEVSRLLPEKIVVSAAGNDEANTTLPAWSQVDPEDLIAMSTPAMKTTLQRYAERKRKEPQAPSTPPRSLTNNRVPGFSSPAKPDQSVLDALPADIRAEIEQEYTRNMENHQLIQKLVQAGPNPRDLSSGEDDMSDRADRPKTKRGRTIATEPAASTSTASTRGGARGARGRTRGRPKKRGTAATSTSKSSRVGSRGGVEDAENDVADRDTLPEGPTVPGAAPKAATDISEEPGPNAEFLAALPPDIRAEIEATYKLEMLKNRQRAQDIREKAAQADNTAARAANPSEGHHHHNGHLTDSTGKPLGTAFALERPTLMGRREIGELRTMISVWVKSTLVYNEEPPDSAAGSSSSGRSKGPLLDEGPNPDDVQSFSDFLTRVIVMERDLDRVRMVLQWLKRRVEENERLLLLAGEDNLTQERKQLLELQKVIVLCTWRQALNQTLSALSRVVHCVYGGRLVLD